MTPPSTDRAPLILADALSGAGGDALVMVADLAAVPFLDCTGINTLLRAHHDQAGLARQQQDARRNTSE